MASLKKPSPAKAQALKAQALKAKALKAKPAKAVVKKAVEKPAAKPAVASPKPAAISKPAAIPKPAAVTSRSASGLAVTRKTIAAYDTASPAFAATHKKIVAAFRKHEGDRDGGLYADALFSDQDSQKWWT